MSRRRRGGHVSAVAAPRHDNLIYALVSAILSSPSRRGDDAAELPLVVAGPVHRSTQRCNAPSRGFSAGGARSSRRRQPVEEICPRSSRSRAGACAEVSCRAAPRHRRDAPTTAAASARGRGVSRPSTVSPCSWPWRLISTRVGAALLLPQRAFVPAGVALQVAESHARWSRRAAPGVVVRLNGREVTMPRSPRSSRRRPRSSRELPRAVGVPERRGRKDAVFRNVEAAVRGVEPAADDARCSPAVGAAALRGRCDERCAQVLASLDAPAVGLGAADFVRGRASETASARGAPGCAIRRPCVMSSYRVTRRDARRAPSARGSDRLVAAARRARGAQA